MSRPHNISAALVGQIDFYLGSSNVASRMIRMFHKLGDFPQRSMMRRSASSLASGIVTIMASSWSLSSTILIMVPLLSWIAFFL